MTDVNATNLDYAGNDYEELTNLYELQFLLDRMLKNAKQLSGNSSGNIVTVTNTNLYSLAEKYYGDPLQWTLIATANNLSDPQILTLTNLIIPEYDGVKRSGIYDE